MFPLDAAVRLNQPNFLSLQLRSHPPLAEFETALFSLNHLPFIQFLPRPLERQYNRMFGSHIPRGHVQDLGLLSARNLRRLFPTSEIRKVRVTFWPETLVAYHIDPERGQ